MKVTFFGAARGVTGSKHVIESDGFKLLLDCGLYQGKRQETYDLNKTLPFLAGQIGAVILSHAHADHCGALPLLVKNGYGREIFATPATADIARLIMLDSAKLQENDYWYSKKHPLPGNKLFPPLYTVDDAESASRHFEPTPYNRKASAWNQLNGRLRFKFYDAGHILGSAITVIEGDESGRKITLAYTGDLGNTHVPILPEPEIMAESVESLIVECTYGDKNHRPAEEVAAFLKEVITDAVKNKRKIVVPAFALGRTQELIYILHKLYDAGQIPVIPIYIDSPLADGITKVFARYKEDYDQEARADFVSRNESPFAFKNLRYISSVEESKSLSASAGPFMVIASSGMAEGGRVPHHLEHTVSDPNAVVILTGYQAENTLGRKLQAGVTPVRIYDKMYGVAARILMIDELSAHADQNGLLSYISRIKGLKKVFLVHAEPRPLAIFKDVLQSRLPALEVIIPKAGETFEV